MGGAAGRVGLRGIPVSSRIMLTITRDLHDKIVAHARADHPDEACGVIAGPAGSDRPERFIAMENELDVGMALNRLEQSTHDDTRAGIAAHGIYRDGQGAGHGHLFEKGGV